MTKLVIALCCCLPLRHLHLNSSYGYRVHPVTWLYKFHNGIDLRARHDTVYAIAGGIATAAYNNYLGIYIKITNGSLTCIYGHLSTSLLSGGWVRAGEAIGVTGATGSVTGEHLHLSVSYNNDPIDPLKFLYHLMFKP